MSDAKAQAPARGALTGPLYVKADPWLRELLFRWKPFEGDQRSNMETELLAALQRVVEEQHRARCYSGDATCHYPDCGCHGNVA